MKHKAQIEKIGGVYFVQVIEGKMVDWSGEPHVLSGRVAKFVDYLDASEWAYYNNVEVVN